MSTLTTTSAAQKDPPTFEAYPKIPRLHRGVVVTEKIDGTNAQIVFYEDGTYRVGSRKRYITPGKNTDNFGFAGWVAEHEEALFELLGPGRHFGEWWGAGIQRGYGLDHKRFSLFNAERYTEGGIGDADPGVQLIEGVHIYTVPVLAVHGTFHSGVLEGAFLNLRTSGSWAAPGFMNPEGIMVYHTAARQTFKWTYEHDAEGKPE